MMRASESILDESVGITWVRIIYVTIDACTIIPTHFMNPLGG